MMKTRRAAAKAAKVAQLHGISKDLIKNQGQALPQKKSGGTKVLQVGMNPAHEVGVGVGGAAPTTAATLDKKEVIELFTSIDTGGDGLLDIDEVKKLLVKLGMPVDDQSLTEVRFTSTHCMVFHRLAFVCARSCVGSDHAATVCGVPCTVSGTVYPTIQRVCTFPSQPLTLFPAWLHL
jgi:hypothetical protein